MSRDVVIVLTLNLAKHSVLVAELHLKVPGSDAGGGSCNRSCKSATTAGDSDLGVAESCVAESCASFEFLDDEGGGHRGDRAVADADNHEGAEQERVHTASPPKVLALSAENGSSAATAPTSAVCSPGGTSEIGSVFGLRFDPQENKMTLQLTAAAGDLPTVCSPSEGPTLEVSKLQPSRSVSINGTKGAINLIIWMS